MIAGATIIFPGLKKRSGSWMVCHGVFSPVLLVDPQTPTTHGYSAMVAHEAYHARKRHKMKEISLWFLWPTVLGYFLWARFRRRIERTADQEALRVFGDEEFRAFLALHKAPSSRWGRYFYGATTEERYKRATGREWVDGQREDAAGRVRAGVGDRPGGGDAR